MFKHVNGETVGENHVLVIFYGFLVKVLVFHFNVSLLGHMRHDIWSLRWCPLASAHWCVRRSWRLFSFCWSSLCAPDFNHKQYQDERSIYLSFPIHIFLSIKLNQPVHQCEGVRYMGTSLEVTHSAFLLESISGWLIGRQTSPIFKCWAGVVRLDRIPSTHKRPEVVRTTRGFGIKAAYGKCKLWRWCLAIFTSG